MISNPDNMKQIDPYYSQTLMSFELELRREPLHVRANAIDTIPDDGIRLTAGETAPVGLIELVKHRVNDVILDSMTTNEKGRVWLTRGDFVEARQCFQAAIGEGVLKAHCNLGIIAENEGNPELAVWHYIQNPKSVQCGVNHCHFLLKQARAAEAIKLGEKVNPLLREKAAHMQDVIGGKLAFVLAMAHQSLNEFDAAHFYLQQAMNRGESNAAISLGKMYMHPSFRGYDSDKAIRCFMHALELGNHYGYICMAMVYLALGKDKDADLVLEKAALYGIEMSEADRACVVMERTMSSKVPNNQ